MISVANDNDCGGNKTKTIPRAVMAARSWVLAIIGTSVASYAVVGALTYLYIYAIVTTFP